MCGDAESCGRREGGGGGVGEGKGSVMEGEGRGGIQGSRMMGVGNIKR